MGARCRATLTARRDLLAEDRSRRGLHHHRGRRLGRRRRHQRWLGVRLAIPPRVRARRPVFLARHVSTRSACRHRAARRRRRRSPRSFAARHPRAARSPLAPASAAAGHGCRWACCREPRALKREAALRTGTGTPPRCRGSRRSRGLAAPAPPAAAATARYAQRFTGGRALSPHVSYCWKTHGSSVGVGWVLAQKRPDINRKRPATASFGGVGVGRGVLRAPQSEGGVRTCCMPPHTLPDGRRMTSCAPLSRRFAGRAPATCLGLGNPGTAQRRARKSWQRRGSHERCAVRLRAPCVGGGVRHPSGRSGVLRGEEWLAPPFLPLFSIAVYRNGY